MAREASSGPSVPSVFKMVLPLVFFQHRIHDVINHLFCLGISQRVVIDQD